MDELLRPGASAVREAQAIYRWFGRDRADEARELITIPPKIKKVLRDFALADPVEAPFIVQAIKFRAAVLETFNRVVREGVQAVDLPEVKETDLEPAEAA